MKFHPSFIEKNGRKEYVVLPYEEFTAITEMLEDAEDLLELRAAKASDDSSQPGVSLESLMQRFGLA